MSEELKACAHCWHSTGTYLTVDPPLDVQVCCRCGLNRNERTGKREADPDHGPFHPLWNRRAAASLPDTPPKRELTDEQWANLNEDFIVKVAKARQAQSCFACGTNDAEISTTHAIFPLYLCARCVAAIRKAEVAAPSSAPQEPKKVWADSVKPAHLSSEPTGDNNADGSADEGASGTTIRGDRGGAGRLAGGMGGGEGLHAREGESGLEGSEPRVGEVVAAPPQEPVAPLNQCDGCRRGMPLAHGVHRHTDETRRAAQREGGASYPDMIGCTKPLYLSAPLPASPTAPPPIGTWAADDIRRVFVAGAKWWEVEKSGGTMWASDVDKAEAEATRRYPPSLPASAE